MKRWLQKIFGKKSRDGYRIGGNGVETAKASYRFDQGDRQQRQSLLKRINHYWARKAESPQASYRSEPGPGGRRRILLAVLVLGAALFFFQKGGGRLFGLLLEDLDYFMITRIEVQGCVSSTADEIRNGSGVKVGDSLLTVDEKAVQERVKKESFWVETLSVSRHWPGTLVLKVREYEPYALIAVGGGERAQVYYLNKRGTPFIKTAFGMDLDFPVITGLEDGDDVQAMAARLQGPLELLRLAAANNPNLPLQSISEVHMDEEEGMVLHLVEYPFPIFFGDGDVRKKFIRLRQVLELLYKPRKTGMDIGRVAYIKMDYLDDKVIVGYSES